MNEKYLKRDISWLSFNQRVMMESYRRKIPLSEQVLFLGIAGSNLDEFFQVRYPVTFQPENKREREELANRQQLENKLHKFLENYYKCTKRFLKEHPIIHYYDGLDKETKEQCDKYFKRMIYPTLQVITLDGRSTFQPTNGLYVLVHTVDKDLRGYYNYIEIPKKLSRFIALPGKNFVIPIESIIYGNLKYLIKNRTIVDKVTVHVLHSAEVYVQSNEYQNPFDMIARTLKERRRSWVTFLELDHKTSMKILPVEANTYVSYNKLVRLSDLKSIPTTIYSEKDRPRQFSPYNTLPNGSMFQIINEKDRLLLHPYESYETSVVRFLEEASRDPNVVSIKITLYRVSNHSRIIDALLHAADQGKSVTVLIELKARFDEQHNMEISQILSEGGVRLVYTKPNIKTHAKLCLVTRMEQNETKIYSHIGTGNYSESNAKQYTDYSLFTANQDIGYDLTRFFNILTSNQDTFKSRYIIYAPHNMRETINQCIDQEIKRAKENKKAQIVCKCNALTDSKIADKLIHAAKAGVKVKLIIRGACILRPMKNLKIYSIVGRWLEHSRVLLFGYGKRATLYIGSSDLMYRNLSLRNELMIRIDDPEIRNRIMYHLNAYLMDTVNRTMILDNYKYQYVTDQKHQYDSQEMMRQEAKKRAALL